MTSGFIEQLGVDPEASAGQLRAAYGRAVARLVRRRKAIVEQGGDPAPIDLARRQLDEAWSVLSDPVRRRRYDAMLGSALLAGTRGSDRGDDAPPSAADALWDEVSDALVHPAAAVAAKLLRVTTHLQQIGRLPLAPSSSEAEPPTLVPHDDDLTAPRVAPKHLNPQRGGAVVSLPGRTGPVRPVVATPESPLRVVDGSSGAPSVLVLPESRPRPPEPAAPVPAPAVPAAPAPAPQAGPSGPLTPADLTALVDAHGYGGALLRAVREARSVPLQDIAESTRISVRYLEAIEADRFADLPSATFVRGYVREMARVLGLDAEAVVAGYMRRISG